MYPYHWTVLGYVSDCILLNIGIITEVAVYQYFLGILPGEIQKGEPDLFLK